MNQPETGPPTPSAVLYLDHTGPPYPNLSKLPGMGALVRRLTDDSNFRRHPRDASYMSQLVKETHGDAYTSRIRQIADRDALAGLPLDNLSAIVLLWRDGNGTGWLPIERHVMRNKPARADVVVLNGRRRQFELTPAVWRAYRLRRFLGKSLIVEAGFFVAFVLTAPFLFAWDVARGYR
jgi:hypothetical protein